MASIQDTPVRLLDEDPDLAAALPADEQAVAARAAVARTYLLGTGDWTPPTAWAGSASTLGLLVLDGLVMRSLELGDRCSTELLGDGDLLRPWQRDTEEAMLACSVRWRVLEPTRVAVLDARFGVATAPWPQIGAAIVGRALRRSRSQGVLAAISHVNRVDDRLVLAVWYFAERWGRVGPEGVAVRLPLTHEQLGAVIGARRPSVTTALSSLAAQGILVPRRRGEWLLTPAARRRIGGPEAARGGAPEGPRLAA